MIIADYGSYCVESSQDNYRQLERYERNKKRKRDREATVSAYIAGSISIITFIIIVIVWIALG